MNKCLVLLIILTVHTQYCFLYTTIIKVLRRSLVIVVSEATAVYIMKNITKQ